MPLYMGISRDDCYIHLSVHHGDCSPGAALRIKLNDVRSFQEELLAKQYKFSRPGVEETEWGSIDMSIGDPFGNRLTFTTEMEGDANV